MILLKNLQINSPSKEESNKNLGDTDSVVERGAGLDNFYFTVLIAVCRRTNYGS